MNNISSFNLIHVLHALSFQPKYSVPLLLSRVPLVRSAFRGLSCCFHTGPWLRWGEITIQLYDNEGFRHNRHKTLRLLLLQLTRMIM